jgi:hypothetical protein
VEGSRKHRPFDMRWPCARKGSLGALSTAPLPGAAEVAEALDWYAFSARYFHEGRRYDSEARSAYAAYRQGPDLRTTPARLSLVPDEPVSPPVGLERDEAGTRRLLAAMAAAHPRVMQSGLPADQM